VVYYVTVVTPYKLVHREVQSCFDLSVYMNKG